MNPPTLEQAVQILDRALQPPESRAPFSRANYVEMDGALRFLIQSLGEAGDRATAAEAKLVEVQAKLDALAPAPAAGE